MWGMRKVVYRFRCDCESSLEWDTTEIWGENHYHFVDSYTCLICKRHAKLEFPEAATFIPAPDTDESLKKRAMRTAMEKAASATNRYFYNMVDENSLEKYLRDIYKALKPVEGWLK